MDDQNRSELAIMCKQFVDAFAGSLSWKWEERFAMALAEFSSNDKDSIQAILERFLSKQWDNSTIGNADSDVQQIVNKYGGLYSGQLLLTPDTEKDDFLFGLWWPWGNGTKVSIRVAPSFLKLPVAEYNELIKEFKGWFSL